MPTSKILICCKSFYPVETPVSLRMQGLVASLNKKYPAVSITVLAPTGGKCDSLGCEIFSTRSRDDGRPSSKFFEFSFVIRQIFLYVHFFCLRREKFDIVIGSTSFLGTGLLAYLLAFLKRSKFILDLRDWPPHSLNLINNKSIRRIYQIYLWLSFKLIRPEMITFTSPQYLNELKKYWPESSMEVILNGSSGLAPIQRKFPDHLHEALNELRHHKLLVYFGNFGYAQDLERIMDWVSDSSSEYSVLLIGGGRDFARLKEKFDTNKRIRILPSIPRDCLSLVVEMSFALVVSIRPGVLSELAVPSKVFEYYLTDKPILLPKTMSLQSIIDGGEDQLIYFYDNNRLGFEFALKELSISHSKGKSVNHDFRNAKKIEFSRKFQSDKFASLVDTLGKSDG